MRSHRTFVLYGWLALFPGVLGAEPATQQPIDDAIATLQSAAQSQGLAEIAEIDHARLATQAGEPMPPSRVLILSDPDVNSQILSQNIRAGLDLPYRVLAFDNTGNASLSFTSFDFLARRHGLNSEFEHQFSKRLDALLKDAPLPVTEAPTDGLTFNYGVLSLRSAYDFETTVKKLKDVVMAQSDTVWFGEVDFTAEAAPLGIPLPQSKLLLFGGPAPGGIAMRDYPAIGLDAFCQKLLVYEDTSGQIQVIFNDIAALADLHYGTSFAAHVALNERLTATFQSATQ
jgi:uncharacterized protein (DUF302 family)